MEQLRQWISRHLDVDERRISESLRLRRQSQIAPNRQAWKRYVIGFGALILAVLIVIVIWQSYEVLWVTPMTEIDRGASQELVAARSDVRKTVVTAIGAAFVAITVIVAMANWRLGQKNLAETRRSIKATEDRMSIEREGQLTDRFTQAIEMMGTSVNGEPQIETRIGGLHALGQVAISGREIYGAIVPRIVADYIRRYNAFTHDPDDDPTWLDIEGNLSIQRRRDDVQTALDVLGDIHPRLWEPIERTRFNRTELELALDPLLLGELNLSASQLSGVRLLWNGPINLNRSMLIDTEFYSLGSIMVVGGVLQWTLLRSQAVVDVSKVESLDNVRIECQVLIGLASVLIITPRTRIIVQTFVDEDLSGAIGWRSDDKQKAYLRIGRSSVPYSVFLTNRPTVPSIQDEPMSEHWLRWQTQNRDYQDNWVNSNLEGGVWNDRPEKAESSTEYLRDGNP